MLEPDRWPLLTEIWQEQKIKEREVLEAWEDAARRQLPQLAESSWRELVLTIRYAVQGLDPEGRAVSLEERLCSAVRRAALSGVSFLTVSYALQLLERELRRLICRVLQERPAEEIINAIVELDEFCHRIYDYVALAFLHTAGRGQIDAGQPAGNLTERESEVFELVVEGYRTREIAERLGVSVKTVEHHRNRVFQKFGVSNVVELVRLAFKRGLIHLL